MPRDGAPQKNGEGEGPGLAESLSRAVDAAGRMVAAHLELARAELERDLRVAGRDVALILAGATVVLVGWLLLMGAAAAALSPALGPAAALALAGAVNVAAGAGLAGVFARRLRGGDRPALQRTSRQLQEDRRWLRTLASPASRERVPGTRT